MQRKNDRILIYDKSDYLIKLVKHYCGDNTDLIFYNDQNKIKLKILKSIDVAYIKSNNNDDLKEILFIHKNTKKIYIDTEKLSIKNELREFNNVIFFNIDKDRFHIMTQIFNSVFELN